MGGATWVTSGIAQELAIYTLRFRAHPPAVALRIWHLQVLEAKGLVKAEELQATIEEVETRGQKGLGAELVVKAWTDPAFKQRLLQNATHAAAELGIMVGEWLHSASKNSE